MISAIKTTSKGSGCINDEVLNILTSTPPPRPPVNAALIDTVLNTSADPLLASPPRTMFHLQPPLHFRAWQLPEVEDVMGRAQSSRPRPVPSPPPLFSSHFPPARRRRRHRLHAVVAAAAAAAAPQSRLVRPRPPPRSRAARDRAADLHAPDAADGLCTWWPLLAPGGFPFAPAGRRHRLLSVTACRSWWS